MQIEGILVFLFCIIYTSSSATNNLSTDDKTIKLLYFTPGKVGRGNYTYYSLLYEGPITLKLYSESGDADLYVSQYNVKPTFEPETYCLQSSTCGIDVVDIPETFTRPVGVGVYGHTSNELSTYVLEVYLRDQVPTEEFDPFLSEVETNTDNEENPRKRLQKESQDNNTEDHAIWGFIWSVIELCIEGLIL